jgi:hypothetical protein
MRIRQENAGRLSVMNCPVCGGHEVLVHRTLLQKLFYRHARRCVQCGLSRMAARGYAAAFIATFAFLTSRYTSCIRCGNPDVAHLPSGDRLESRTWNPFGWMQALIGAPPLLCPICRIKFHDYRSVRPLPQPQRKAS